MNITQEKFIRWMQESPPSVGLALKQAGVENPDEAVKLMTETFITHQGRDAWTAAAQTAGIVMGIYMASQITAEVHNGKPGMEI